jgi:predicted methyltransferase
VGQHNEYKNAYHTHQYPDHQERKKTTKVSKEEIFARISQTRISQNPDPATVEAELRREEDLWNN